MAKRIEQRGSAGSSHGGQKSPWMVRLLARPLVPFTKAIQKFEVVGELGIPASGPVIIASNHTCHLDALTLAVAVYESGRTPRFAVRSDLFHRPLAGWILRKAGQIPVYRPDSPKLSEDGGNAASSLEDMYKVLGNGQVLIIFPESTFTRDPQLWPMKAKTGVARLALAYPDAVVIPMAHWGNEEIYNPYSGKISWRKIGKKRTHLQLRAGKAVNIDAYRGCEINAEMLHEVTEVIMSAITAELEVLRGEEARYPAWDRKLDGDAYAESTQKHHERFARRYKRRVRIKKMLCLPFTALFSLFRSKKSQ